MIYEELEKVLTDEEKAAIEVLERRGFSIMTEARLDDCKIKDGSRLRTFSLSGRYALMLGLKSVDERLKSFLELAAEVEPDAIPETDKEPEVEKLEKACGTVIVDVGESSEIKDENPEAKEEGDNIVDNFWMELNRWKRLARDAFCVLVTEEAVDDLIAAPADVQAEVKEKFDRLCDPDSWPIRNHRV